MYDHEIKEQVQLLIKEGVLPQNKEEKAFKVLREKHWHNKIALVWSAEDVIEHAHNSNVSLDEDDAIEILGSIHHNHDCEYGVTWETLQSHIDDVENAEYLKIKNSKMKDLPILLNSLKSESAQRMLEKRLKGDKNWERVRPNEEDE